MSQDAGRPDECAVVISLCGGAALDNCLARLRGEIGRCLVVLRDDQACRRAIRHPDVEVLVCGRRPVPWRRLLALEAVGAELVALLEDTTWPKPGWWGAARSALADPTVAMVGGPVEISTELPTRLQALGWAEYGAFAPYRQPNRRGSEPAAPGRAVRRVPGNNFAVRRTPVLDAARGSALGLSEEAVGARLSSQGFGILHVPGMRAVYAGEDWRNGRVGSRFHHGRIYGGHRFADRRWLSRLALAARAPALPVLLWWRIMAAVRRTRGLRALPGLAGWSAVLATAWSVGEVTGYLAGAGRSPDQWQ